MWPLPSEQETQLLTGETSADMGAGRVLAAQL